MIINNLTKRTEKYILNLFKKKNNFEEITFNKKNLTHRQNQIINFVKDGKTNKEIAVLISISENTVKYHLKQIYIKLEISSRKEL